MSVVLVHGLGMSHRYFARLWRRLPRAQCPDLAGATVDELADSLAAVVREPALIVANSYGCQVAVELAVREPALATALILIGPSGFAHSLADYAGRLAVGATREELSLDALAMRDYVRWGPARFLRAAKSMQHDPFTAKLPHVDAPTIVMRGERDPQSPQEWAERVASLLPRGRLVVVPGAAHAVHWSHPAVVEELVHEIGER